MDKWNPLGGSLAKFLIRRPDRAGLEDPVLGTEIDRNLPKTAVNRRCGNPNHLARIPLGRLLAVLNDVLDEILEFACLAFQAVPWLHAALSN